MKPVRMDDEVWAVVVDLTQAQKTAVTRVRKLPQAVQRAVLGMNDEGWALLCRPNGHGPKPSQIPAEISSLLPQLAVSQLTVAEATELLRNAGVRTHKNKSISKEYVSDCARTLGLNFFESRSLLSWAKESGPIKLCPICNEEKKPNAVRSPRTRVGWRWSWQCQTTHVKRWKCTVAMSDRDAKTAERIYREQKSERRRILGPKASRGFGGNTLSEEVVHLLRFLLSHFYTAGEIARVFNRLGWKTLRGSDWTAKYVENHAKSYEMQLVGHDAERPLIAYAREQGGVKLCPHCKGEMLPKLTRYPSCTIPWRWRWRCGKRTRHADCVDISTFTSPEDAEIAERLHEQQRDNRQEASVVVATLIAKQRCQVDIAPIILDLSLERSE